MPIFNENLKKIYSLYNRKKLKILITNLFEIVLQYFSQGILIKLCINILIKLAAKLDIQMILKFLEALSGQVFKNPKEINNKLLEDLKKQSKLDSMAY